LDELLAYYKAGFTFKSETELGCFVKYCLRIVKKYLEFLVSRGKLYIPFELNTEDSAVELLAEVFTKENNRLVKFYNFFHSVDQPPETE
jgi:hypothetical protein